MYNGDSFNAACSLSDLFLEFRNIAQPLGQFHTATGLVGPWMTVPPKGREADGFLAILDTG
jgi:hypothetical protein